MQCVRMRGVCVLALVTILAALATSLVSAQTTRRPDGQPRPPGYPETPTRAYGETPPCMDPTTNLVVDCEWYGFAHEDYPTTGLSCLVRTRAFMSNTSLVGRIAPYSYYYLTSQVFDPTTNASYCVYGCFKIDAASVPGSAPAPAPLDSALPPAGTAEPPSPVVAEPPPAPTPVFLEPPPAPTPVFLEPPPAPTPLFQEPPSVLPPTTPGVAVPPAGPRGVINLNAAGLVRPVTGVLSLVVSGALLVLYLLVC